MSWRAPPGAGDRVRHHLLLGHLLHTRLQVPRRRGADGAAPLRDGEMEPRSSRDRAEVTKRWRRDRSLSTRFLACLPLASRRPAPPPRRASTHRPPSSSTRSTRSPRSGAQRASTAARRQGASGARPRRVRDMSARRARGVAPRQVGAARAGAGLGRPRHISAHLGTPRHISTHLGTPRHTSAHPGTSPHISADHADDSDHRSLMLALCASRWTAWAAAAPRTASARM